MFSSFFDDFFSLKAKKKQHIVKEKQRKENNFLWPYEEKNNQEHTKNNQQKENTTIISRRFFLGGLFSLGSYCILQPLLGRKNKKKLLQKIKKVTAPPKAKNVKKLKKILPLKKKNQKSTGSLKIKNTLPPLFSYGSEDFSQNPKNKKNNTPGPLFSFQEEKNFSSFENPSSLKKKEEKSRIPRDFSSSSKKIIKTKNSQKTSLPSSSNHSPSPLRSSGISVSLSKKSPTTSPLVGITLPSSSAQKLLLTPHSPSVLVGVHNPPPSSLLYHSNLSTKNLYTTSSSAYIPCGKNFQDKTPVLKFVNIHTGDRFTLSSSMCRYPQYFSEAMKSFSHFCRDHRRQAVFPMDGKLLYLLGIIGHHFGIGKEVQLISGYRHPKSNALLRRQSSGVAENSFHCKGKALDIKLQHVSNASLSSFLKKLPQHQGGVGAYNLFVHFDTRGQKVFW